MEVNISRPENLVPYGLWWLAEKIAARCGLQGEALLERLPRDAVVRD